MESVTGLRYGAGKKKNIFVVTTRLIAVLPTKRSGHTYLSN
jgi:hypothetical protein